MPTEEARMRCRWPGPASVHDAGIVHSDLRHQLSWTLRAQRVAMDFASPNAGRSTAPRRARAGARPSTEPERSRAKRSTTRDLYLWGWWSTDSRGIRSAARPRSPQSEHSRSPHLEVAALPTPCARCEAGMPRPRRSVTRAPSTRGSAAQAALRVAAARRLHGSPAGATRVCRRWPTGARASRCS